MFKSSAIVPSVFIATEINQWFHARVVSLYLIQAISEPRRIDLSAAAPPARSISMRIPRRNSPREFLPGASGPHACRQCSRSVFVADSLEADGKSDLRTVRYGDMI